MATMAVGQQLRVNETRFIVGDSTCSAQIICMLPTPDPGFFTVGSTSCFNMGDIHSTVNPLAQGLNVLVMKMDSNLNISWTKVYGGSKTDNPVSVCATSDGGYAIVAGSTSSDGDVPGLKGSSDIWLIKTDRNGNKLWSAVFGGSGAGGPVSVTETPDHNLLVLGVTNAAGNDVPFTYVNTPFSNDWILIKTDSAGNKKWVKTMGGTGNENTRGAVLATPTGYYVASSTDSKDYDCTDSNWHIGVNTNADFILIKTDTAGNVIWDSTYGGSNDDVVNSAIFDVRDSSIVIAGSTKSPDYMVHNFQGTIVWDDFWVIKTDKNGKLIWSTTLIDTTASGSYNEAKAVIPGPNNTYAVYGDVYVGRIGQQDGRLFVLDSGGNVLANNYVGGTGYEWDNALAACKDGYVVGGNTTSTTFAEGTNIGVPTATSSGFVSFVDYWPELTEDIHLTSPQLVCYPNPAKNTIRVQLTTGELEGVIRVIYNNGKQIYEQHVASANLDIATKNWSRGVYIIQFVNDSGQVISAKLSLE